MQLEFTGRQMEVTLELRRHTEERLKKLARILRGHFDAHVILAAEKHRRTAEITLKFRRFTLVGVEETADSLASINGAVDKIERQAVRRIDRKRTKKRRPKPSAAILVNVLGTPSPDREERRVLETERIPIKPLTIDEAIDSLDGARSGIVVFRNPDTERVNVIYRRQDGNLGMIEPEP